nr:putative phage tail-component protein [uncultured Mediterranean phage uvMED]
MHPYNLIGLPYRLGAEPEKHKAADCLSLARTIVTYFGADAPLPRREWYRRLRRGDYSVFSEELANWGVQVTSPRLVTVALCRADNGYGMATYFEDGWIGFVGSEVRWSPYGALDVAALYCPMK